MIVVSDQNELDARKPWVVFISHRSEKLRLLQPGLEIENSKPRLKKWYLQMHLLTERFVLLR
jgi:hypothetical protein